MSPGRLSRAAAAALALAAAAGVPAADESAWWVPDQVKVQFAGNIGFASTGLGWATGGRALELDVFLGWVPEAVAHEADIWAITGKLTWQPWTQELFGPYILRPLSMGLQVTYTFGREFFVDPPPRFPGDYYDFPTALRAGLAVGGNAAYRTTGGAVAEVGIYWELVALDVMLFNWARNPRALGPTDVFSLALGLRAAF